MSTSTNPLPPGDVPQRVDVLAPLRHAAFRHLAAGRFVSMLGNSIAPMALAFAVLDLTGSVADLGLVVGARSLTNVLFLLFGGVLADRFPRHLVMVGSSLLAAGSQAAVAVLVLTGHASIASLAALSAVNGMVAAFAFPASAAILPQTVPAPLLQQANAVNRLGTSAAMIGGAGLGGVLIGTVGPGWGLAADAMTFVFGALFFAAVRTADVRTRTGGPDSVLAELRDGWNEFASRSWLWVVVLAFMFMNAAFTGGVRVLGPAIADDTIGRPGWAVVLGANTAGMIVGALIAMRLRVRRLLLLGCVCMLGELPLLIGLAEAPTLPVLVFSGLVGGVAVEQFGIAWDSSLQQHIPAEKLARVYSYDMLGSFLAIPVGQTAVGPVALAIGVGPTLLAAAGIVLLAVIAMVANRGVRTLRTIGPAPN